MRPRRSRSPSEDGDCDQLIVIAGTGSGVAARRGFQAVARAGSHEYLLGDDGGAFAVGRRALRAVIAQLEGRGPATRLADLVADRLGGAEIDWHVYGSGNPKQAVAEFARDVFEADRGGDRVAGEILDRPPLASPRRAAPRSGPSAHPRQSPRRSPEACSPSRLAVLGAGSNSNC
jgi:hypothetical protein